MIKANGNVMQYGIKHLVFDDMDKFKAYTGVAATGSTAYIIEAKKAYILKSDNTWYPLPSGGSGSGSDSGGGSDGSGHTYPIDGDGGDIDEEVEVIYVYDGGEIK